MNLKEGLVLGVLIALLCIPAAVSAAEGGGPADPYYIVVDLDEPKVYLNLNITTVDALDPLDTENTLVTLQSTESGDLKAIEYPLLGTITREFYPASGHYNGAYVTVRESKTVDGGDFPGEYRVYITRTIPSFTVNVSDWLGNVLLVKCPENVDPEASFTEIFNTAEKKGYLFKDDGILHMNKTNFTAHGGGFTGNSNYNETDLAYTLNQNEVNLASFTTDSNLARDMMETRPYTRPDAGEYLLTAVKYDSANTTMHILAAMPVLILEEDTHVTWSGDKPYYQDQSNGATVSFENGVDKIAYALVKKDTTYGLTVKVNTTELAEEPVPASPADLVSILKSIAGEAEAVTYTLTTPTSTSVNVTQEGSGLFIAEGYGCSGYANESSSVEIAAETLATLNPGTYYLYALGMNDQKVTAIDQIEIDIEATKPTPTPTTPPRRGGGGGGGGGGFAPETGSASPLIGSDGKLLRPYTIRSPSGIAELNLPLGTYAVDADGNPLSEVSIDDLDPADLPAVPAGAAYTFAGHAVVCSPSGARFDPAISLVFTFNADQWSEIMQAAEYDASSLVVKWYDEEAGEWETVPTVVDPATRTVTASVEHFTVFGLFVEPGAATVVTPTTPTVTPATPTTPTTTTPVTPPAEGFPWTYVVIAVVIILVIAIGVYYYTRKP